MANIIRRRETEDMPSLLRDLDPLRLAREMLSWDPFREMAPLGRAEVMRFSPDFDVKETKDAYVFKADLPGVDEKELEISLTGNRLMISGKREAEERKDGDNYFCYERAYGSFSRAFTLPEHVDGDHVSADMKNGVLTITVPKRPEAQPKRIEIKAGKEGAKA